MKVKLIESIGETCVGCVYFDENGKCNDPDTEFYTCYNPYTFTSGIYIEDNTTPDATGALCPNCGTWVNVNSEK